MVDAFLHGAATTSVAHHSGADSEAATLTGHCFKRQMSVTAQQSNVDTVLTDATYTHTVHHR